MASVRGLSRASQLLNQATRYQRCIHTSSVAAGDIAPWNYLWKPKSSAPTENKEKEIAAKKYGLIPEDYKPRPDTGDYPDLDGIGSWDRDNFELWDYPETKRNFLEPGPFFDRDIYLPARYAESYQYASRVKLGTQFLFVLCAFGFFVLYHNYGEVGFFPVMPKQKPYDENGNRIVNYSMD